MYSVPTLTPCRVSSSHNAGYLLKNSFSTAIKWAMSNFMRNVAMPSSCKALAIGAYVDGPSPRAWACCFVNKIIACLCWSVPAWSLMLLTRTDSAPMIHLSLKFRLPVMFSNVAHVEHFKAVTFFPPTSH